MTIPDTVPTGSTLVVFVPYENFGKLLMREAMITVFLMCHVDNPKQTFAHMDTISLLKPSLTLKVRLLLLLLLIIIITIYFRPEGTTW